MSTPAKRRDVTLDFIRVISMWMIVNFHFASAMGRFQPMELWRLNTWGSVGNALFFMLSGYVMLMTHREIKSLPKFYLGRFKAIFPMLWLVFIIGLIAKLAITGIDLSGVNPASIIFSFIGVDAYMAFFGVRTFYFGVNEWFMTVTILLYAIYPLLAFLYKKAKVITSVVITIAFFAMQIFYPPINFPLDAVPLNGLFLFWLGMILCEITPKLRRLPWAIIISLICLVIGLGVMFFFDPGPVRLPWSVFLAVSIFLILLLLFPFVERLLPEAIKKIINYFATISYATFLCHHIIIYLFTLIGAQTWSTPKFALFYIATIAFILICSILIYKLNSLIVGTIFKKKNRPQ